MQSSLAPTLADRKLNVSLEILRLYRKKPELQLTESAEEWKESGLNDLPAGEQDLIAAAARIVEAFLNQKDHRTTPRTASCECPHCGHDFSDVQFTEAGAVMRCSRCHNRLSQPEGETP